MTEKECSKCHEVKPLTEFYKHEGCRGGHRPECKVCCRKAHQAQRHTEAGQTVARAWRQSKAGRASKRASMHRYRQTKNGRAVSRQATARYRQTEKGRQTHRSGIQRYNQTEKGKARSQRHYQGRRARKAGAPGSHTRAEFVALCQATGLRCLRCRDEFPLEALTEDHIIPLSEGGSDDIENIQVLCRCCNSTKGIQMIDYRGERPRWQQARMVWP